MSIAINKQLEQHGITDPTIVNRAETLVVNGVPQDQAVRSILREEGISATVEAKDWSNADNANLTVTISDLWEPTGKVQAKGRVMAFGQEVMFSAFKPVPARIGAQVKLEDAKISEYNGKPQLTIGSQTTVEVVKDGPEPTHVQVKELDGSPRVVDVTVKVVEMREIAKFTKPFWVGRVADATGQVGFTSSDPGFQDGDSITIKGAIAGAYNGAPTLRLNNHSIEVVNEVEASSEEVAATAQDLPLHEVVGQKLASVRTSGRVVRVLPNSGLIKRCGHCDKIVKNRQPCCSEAEGKMKPDLRIRCVIDDGQGCADAFIGRDATQAILELTPEEAEEQAREAMDASIHQDTLEQRLAGRHCTIEGWSTVDDYGTTIFAREATFDAGPDYSETVRRLGGAL